MSDRRKEGQREVGCDAKKSMKGKELGREQRLRCYDYGDRV